MAVYHTHESYSSFEVARKTKTWNEKSDLWRFRLLLRCPWSTGLAERDGILFAEENAMHINACQWPCQSCRYEPARRADKPNDNAAVLVIFPQTVGPVSRNGSVFHAEWSEYTY